VQITRGRLTNIERVSGPPDPATAGQMLQQDIVQQVDLQTSDGQAWIAPLHDLHLLNWESDSTGSVLSGGGPRVGRVVGWAYGRIIDPRLPARTVISPVSTLSPATAPLKEAAAVGGFVVANSTSGQLSRGPVLPHPCRLCSWGRIALLFLFAWIICSLGWACLAIAPFVLRCVMARIRRRITMVQEGWIESAVLLSLGVAAFGFAIWQATKGCVDAPVVALLILSCLIPWSVRLRHCWVIGLLSWMWVLGILMTCPAKNGACQDLPKIGANLGELVPQAQNTLNQIFRPDRDAADVAGQAGSADGWIRTSVDEVQKHPERFFDCTGKIAKKRDQYVIYMGESALFDLNKAELNEDAESQLTRLGELIQKYPQTRMVVVGHADKSPHINGPVGNLTLSEKRADVVVQWLVDRGYANPEHIVAMGAGDRYPLFDTPGQFRGNRRVEVRVVCPGAKP
jgi:outer membrane protein OmpA-like peptidoglycan-associated protein